MDEHFRAAVEHIEAGLRVPLEAALRHYGDELRRAAAADRDAAVRDAVAGAARDAQDRLERELAAVRSELIGRVEELARESEGRLESARASAEADIAAARIAADAAVAVARQHAESEMQTLRRTLEQDAAAARAAAEREFEARLGRSRTEHEDAVKALDAALVRREKDARERSRLQRLLDALQALDRASSLGEVLSRTAGAARADGRRALLLLVEGQRMREWSAPATAATTVRGTVEVSLDAGGFAAEAVRTGRPAIGGGHGGESRPVFAGPEYRGGAAVPILVSGAVVAVLYAEPSADDRADEADVPGELEALARHAGLVLEAMTVQRALGLTPPRTMAHAPAARLQEGSR